MKDVRKMNQLDQLKKLKLFKNKTRVKINLGDGKEATGTVVGTAAIGGFVMIVLLDKPDPWNYEYDAITILASNLEEL